METLHWFLVLSSQTHLQLVDVKQNWFGGGIFPFKGEAGTAAKNLLIRIIFLAVVNDMLWSDTSQFCHLLLKIHQHVQVKVLCCHLKIFETAWNWFSAPDLAWNRSSGRLDWAPYLKFSGWWEIQAGKVKPRILAADPQNYNAVKLWYLHLYPLFP